MIIINFLKQTKTLINAKKDAIIIINDVNEEEMTLNEALSKMADLNKKINSKKFRIGKFILKVTQQYESYTRYLTFLI